MPGPNKNNHNDAVLNGYLNYWDEIVSDWKQGKPPNDELFTLLVSKKESFGRKYRIQPEAMPEPYWGDPANCSIVLGNLNPGGGEAARINPDSPHRTAVRFIETFGMAPKKYRDLATSFPVLMSDVALEEKGWNDFLGYNGRGWWLTGIIPEERKRRTPRICWPCRVLRHYGRETGKKPFAMELCGWHSENWIGLQRTMDVVADKDKNCFEQYLTDRVAAPFCAAVEKSDTGMGLCIGKDWRSVFSSYVEGPIKLATQFDRTEFASLSGPKNHKTGKPFRRHYQTFTWSRAESPKRVFTILVTWPPRGFNNLPAERFSDLEYWLLDGRRSHIPSQYQEL